MLSNTLPSPTKFGETKTTLASPLKLRSQQTSPARQQETTMETAVTPLKIDMKKTEGFSSLYSQTAASEKKDVTPSGYYTRNVSPDQATDLYSTSFK